MTPDITHRIKDEQDESTAPDMCICGHTLEEHDDSKNKAGCLHEYPDGIMSTFCECKEFTSDDPAPLTEAPAQAAQQATAQVLPAVRGDLDIHTIGQFANTLDLKAALAGETTPTTLNETAQLLKRLVAELGKAGPV